MTELNLFPALRAADARVASGEFLDAPGGIDELLLPGEEGMASCTDADLQIALRGAGVINGAASASDGGLFVFRVNICFHDWKKEGGTLQSASGSATEISKNL